MSRRSFTFALAALLILALAIRVAAALGYNAIEPQTDALDYDRHAVSIATGNGYPEALGVTGGPGPTAFRPPIYPFVLAGVYEISGTADERQRWQYGRLAQALLGVAIVALISLVVLQLWGQREALLAAAIAATYPPLILAGTSLLSEPLFTALLLGGIAGLLRWRLGDGRARWLALAGACAGLATLTRGNGLVVVAILALAAWTLKPRLSLRSLAAPAIVVAAAALVVAPWTVRNAVELDAFVPVTTQSGLGLAGVFNDTATENDSAWQLPSAVPEYRPLFRGEGPGEVEVSRRLTDLALDYAIEHPESIVSAAGWNTLRFLGLHHPIEHERQNAFYLGQPQGLAEFSVYAFWLLALGAIAGSLTPAARRLPAFVWAIPPLFLVTVLFVGGNARYRMPVEPIFILLAVAAASWGWQRLARSGERTRSSGA